LIRAIKRRDLLMAGSGTAAAVIAAANLTPTPAAAAAATALHPPLTWDHTADVVVIGAGCMGLPAAILAREAGSSVILLEAEADIGGHAITSGGNVPLGGGTSQQKKYGIKDSPDLLFSDLTDWSVTRSSARLPTTARQRSNSSSRTAWCSSTRRPTFSAAPRSAIPCRASTTRR